MTPSSSECGDFSPDRGPRPLRQPLARGALVMAVLLVYFAVTGVLVPGEISSFWSSPMQLTGMALMLSAVPAFLAAILPASRRRTRELLAELVASGTLDAEDCQRSIDELESVPRRFVQIGFAIGLILVAFNTFWSMLFALPESPSPVTDVAITLATTGLWLLLTQVVAGRFHRARVLGRLAGEHARIDLFRLDELSPFGRLANLDLLMIAGCLSLMPLQALDAEFRFANYSWATLLAAIAAGLVLWQTTLEVRRRVRAEKQREIGEIDTAIADADTSLESGALRHLNELLARRDFVRHLREWPFDTTAFSRIGLYVVLPPLAWTGAALVEMFVSALIGATS